MTTISNNNIFKTNDYEPESIVIRFTKLQFENLKQLLLGAPYKDAAPLIEYLHMELRRRFDEQLDADKHTASPS